MSEKLTTGQFAVLQYLHGRQSWGNSPVSSEISYGLDHRSRDWADAKLRALLARGYVQVDGVKAAARTWAITDTGLRAFKAGAALGLPHV